MKIIISGYGKMGKEIDKEARRKNYDVLDIFDKPDDWKKLAGFVEQQPIVIDFSEPGEVIGNIEKCFLEEVPMVVGTTGWDAAQEDIRQRCMDNGHSLFVASNFSIGMNLFFALNEFFAGMMNDFADYDITLEEIHHLQKKDRPSGTAITLAKQIIEKIERKKDWKLSPNESNASLTVTSIREADVPGIHKIIYDADSDIIELKHTAKNRLGFARGALIAAEWLQGRIGYFSMKDLLQV